MSGLRTGEYPRTPMKTHEFLRQAAVAAGAAGLAACGTPHFGTHGGEVSSAGAAAVKFQQIRNATIKLEYAGTVFLVDPMLARKGAYPGFAGSYNGQLRNPLVELPLPVDEVMKADAVIVTHTHLDHWDDSAKQGLPRALPIFAQNEEDARSIRQAGFTDVRVVGEDTVFNGTRLVRTGGQHGDDRIMAAFGERLGQVSGVVFQRAGHKTVYVAGDTVWNGQVENAIRQYQPDVIVLNTGYARFQGFEGSIIMGKEDLYRAHQAAPQAHVVGSHMEALNHCTQSRQELRDYIAEKGMDARRVRVPADGESYSF
jgi:L-ascorbate metabolism protein UlaG (beta-lactamase superfamily)